MKSLKKAEYEKKYRQQRYQRLADYKLARGCADCGYNAFSEALEFDHVKGDKFMNITRMSNNAHPWDEILKEIEKCEVVCANCHRVRTAFRRA